MPINSAGMFDAVAKVQRHKPTETFGDLATDILRSVIKSARTNRINVASEVYGTHSTMGKIPEVIT